MSPLPAGAPSRLVASRLRLPSHPRWSLRANGQQHASSREASR